MTTMHEKLIETLRAMDKCVTTDELVAACREEVPESSTADVLDALQVVQEELTAHAAWLRSARVSH